MPSNTGFPSPTSTSPGSACQPCAARQHWRQPARRLAARYQQSCFRLLLSAGADTAVSISTWGEGMPRPSTVPPQSACSAASHALQPPGGKAKLSPLLLALLPPAESDAPRTCCSGTTAELRSRGAVSPGTALHALFNLSCWHGTNTFQRAKGKVRQALPQGSAKKFE